MLVNMDNTKIYAITQSILAIIVTVGGGFMFTHTTDGREAIAGIIGLVVGFYFRESSGAVTASRVYQAQNGTTKPSSVSQ